MNDRLIADLEKLNNRSASVRVLKDEPMSVHTSFRIGGPAALFILPDSADSFLKTVGLLREHGVGFFILGKGSNVLFPDAGYAGAVVCTSELDSVSFYSREVTADAGVSLTALSRMAAENSLTGLEFAFGIPGSVGGAVYMNAGAYGGEMAQVVVETTAVDRETGEISVFRGNEHLFGYRTSCFKNNNHVILSSRMTLSHGSKDDISEKMGDLLQRRQQKQPLEYPSAGSVFKRPEGHFAGQLIEEAGLKGYTVGGASVSEKHAGFIINKGGATAKDVLTLIEHIQTAVLESSGVDLECEIIYVE